MSPSALPRLLAPVLAALLLAPLGPLGCGGDDDEQDALSSAVAEIASAEDAALPRPANRQEAQRALGAARDLLAERTTVVDEARTAVGSARLELDAAEARLEEARKAFEAVELDLAQAAAQMRQFAVPDAVLFRKVQSELLDSSALRDVAIAAEVKEGVVALRGRVPDADTRSAAVDLVTGIDGVISVDDRIEVASAED